MRDRLERAHNRAHGYIGGTIGDPHTSFRDPFVFLLHSNVDRIFALWQLQPGKEWRLDPEQVYGAESNTDIVPGSSLYDPGILTPLDPWAGNPNSHPDVRRIRPWTTPENEHLRPENRKNSKHPSVVAPPAYDTNAEWHPRFLADVTGDGRADIVGFGDAGVWVSLNNGDGTFQDPPKRVLDNFAYNAGGWRVERHPRFLADVTGDRSADIVGFGEVGVWVSLNNGDGTFQAPQKVVDIVGL